MSGDTPIALIRQRVDDLEQRAREIYNLSLDFPAVNRNAKRILAAAKMLQLNVEAPESEETMR